MSNEKEKLYATCPVCARKLGKGENGTKIDILCPRCKNMIAVIIEKDIVNTFVLEKKKN